MRDNVVCLSTFACGCVVLERKVYPPCTDIVICTVNGKAASQVKYDDPYSLFKIHGSATVHQHHMLRKRLDGVLHDPPEFELVIALPPSVRIEPAVSILFPSHARTVCSLSVCLGIGSVQPRRTKRIDEPQFHR